jgi:hypothetical protein
MLVGSGTLQNGGWNTAGWKAHLAVDWFGKEEDAQHPGTFVRPPLPTSPTPTGFWKAYEGDVEGIVRETLRRGIEVALGVAHNVAVPQAPYEPSRHWPIELFVKCAQGWVEGWVTWRRRGDGPRGGQVTILISTPGDGPNQAGPDAGQGGSVVRLSPIPPASRQGRDFEINPVSTVLPSTGVERRQGMWVITHRRHEKWGPGNTTLPSKKGDWPPPIGSGITGRPADAGGQYPAQFQPIVTVSPSEADGGVLAVPRVYT